MKGDYQISPLGKLLLAGLATYAIVGTLNSFDHDTVVYYLYHNNRIVYIGVAYEDRIEARLDEHDRRGLIYDEYDFTSAMTRDRALAKERRLIGKHTPKYNVHHNLY